MQSNLCAQSISIRGIIECDVFRQTLYWKSTPLILLLLAENGLACSADPCSQYKYNYEY